jgi:hypothetical protein
MKHSNFLQFNGSNLLFTNAEGITYIAISPICKALKINENRAIRNLKKDRNLGPAVSMQTYQVAGKSGFQARKLTCLPEFFIYPWILGVQSDSKELQDYKWTCYKLLFNHFNGIIGKRKEFLIGVAETQLKIDYLKKELLNNKSYIQMIELENTKKIYSAEMKKIDKQAIGQTEFNFN